MAPLNFSNINSIIGKELQNSVTGSILGGFSSYLQFKDIQNSNLNRAQKSMGKGDAALQGVASAAQLIPGVGHAVGLGLNLLNTVGGSFVKQPKLTKDYQSNQDVMASGAFSGTANDASEVENSINTFSSSGLVGKLTGKNKMLNQTMASQKSQMEASNIINESKKAFANIGSANMFDTRTKMKQSGYSMDSLRMGKEGLKIEAKQILKKFQTGGTIQKNVILNGVLHARKHNLKEIDKFTEAEITHKGIPVITEMKDGNIIQHAEVEKDELVMHYDLTKKLEKLMEIGTDDAMIEAGKILSKELIKNTKDSKSKLLKKV